jgi:hypothetical protein
MKSELNFIVIKGSTTLDMHELGIWVSSFHIHSPNMVHQRVKMPDKPGSILVDSQEDERPVFISMQIEEDNYKEFDALKHRIYEVFYSPGEFKIIRDINPDKEINVIQEGSYDIENITAEDGEFELSLTMIDPHLYGAQKTQSLVHGNNIIENNATADVLPITKVNFTQEATYFSLIAPEGKFMLIGNPKAVDQVQLPPLELLVDDECTDLTQWSTSGVSLDYGVNAGAMGVKIVGGDDAFLPTDYGDDATYSNVWHGPAITRTLPQTLDDFRIEITLEMQPVANGIKETGRIDLTLRDMNGADIGTLNLRDAFADAEYNIGTIYAGPQSDKQEMIYSSGPRKYDWNKFFGTLVLRREKDLENPGQYIWSAAIVCTDRTTDVQKMETHVYDYIRTNRFGSELGSVQLHMSKYGSTPNIYQQFHHMRIWKINQVTSYDIPALFKAGDELVINHDTGKAYLNGELFLDYIDAGSEFFALPPGATEIVVSTDDNNALVNMEYTEMWL